MKIWISILSIVILQVSLLNARKLTRRADERTPDEIGIEKRGPNLISDPNDARNTDWIVSQLGFKNIESEKVRERRRDERSSEATRSLELQDWCKRVCKRSGNPRHCKRTC